MNEELKSLPIPGLDPPIRSDRNQEFLIAQMHEIKSENTKLHIEREDFRGQIRVLDERCRIATRRAEEYRRLYMMYFKKYTEK